jgi:hypothetical protein
LKRVKTIDEILPFILSRQTLKSKQVIYLLNQAIDIKRYDVIDMLLKYDHTLMTERKFYLRLIPIKTVASLLKHEPRFAKDVPLVILQSLRYRNENDLYWHIMKNRKR